MTVKEAVLLAATELGIVDDVQEYLENGIERGEGKRNADLLLTCFNLVENEIALDYLPLYAEDDLQTLTGLVRYNSLRHTPVHILKITDNEGNNVKFTLFPDCFKLAKGKYTIYYTYTPEKKTMTEKSDFEKISSRLFSYGMAAEYATVVGLYEEAKVWDKKYKDALAAVYHATPSVRTVSRRWA